MFTTRRQRMAAAADAEAARRARYTRSMSPSMQAVLMGAPDPLTPAVCKATRSREEFVVDADIAAFLSIHRGRVLNSAMTVRNGRPGYVVTLAVI